MKAGDPTVAPLRRLLSSAGPRCCWRCSAASPKPDALPRAANSRPPMRCRGWAVRMRGSGSRGGLTGRGRAWLRDAAARQPRPPRPALGLPAWGAAGACRSCRPASCPRPRPARTDPHLPGTHIKTEYPPLNILEITIISNSIFQRHLWKHTCMCDD